MIPLKLFHCLLFSVIVLLCLSGCAKAEHTAPLIADTPAQTTGEQSQTAGTTVTTCTTTTEITTTTITAFERACVIPYHGEPCCEINNSLPFFQEKDLTTTVYDRYSPLDELGRCGVCEACIGQEIMPTEKRGSIGAVKPSGWHLIRYDGLVDGNYLYNRCHLIAYMLTGQNANECNLITGTRYLNKEGMLPFEIMTADYIRETGNHVLYRVTPVFEGDHLLADGVLMEALSVEDHGAGIRFNVFCYNVQPEIVIDYVTGESRLADPAAQTGTTPPPEETNAVTEETVTRQTAPADVQADYILNTNSRRFHRPDCESVADISEKNKEAYTGDRETLIAEGYEPCHRCDP